MEPLSGEDNQSNPASFWIAYKVPVILAAVSISVIILSLVLLVKSTQTTTPIQFTTHDAEVAGTQSASLKTVVVDVEGAVVAAGTYSLPVGARVEDAIQAAGGLANTADEEYIAKNINRAMKITDGMKVYIPVAGDTSHIGDCTTSQGDVVQSCGVVTTSLGLSQNATVISVNSALKDQLDSLPGVGPVTAQKIIDNRPYASLEDLVTKKAIGPSLFEKLKNQLSL
jgi:competence protein ComEA